MSPGAAQAIFWLAAAACAVAQAALIRSVLAASRIGSYPDDRRKSSRRDGMRWGPDRRSATDGTPPSSSSRELEIGWALLPALGLAALLIATWLTLPA